MEVAHSLCKGHARNNTPPPRMHRGLQWNWSTLAMASWLVKTKVLFHDSARATPTVSSPPTHPPEPKATIMVPLGKMYGAGSDRAHVSSFAGWSPPNSTSLIFQGPYGDLARATLIPQPALRGGGPQSPTGPSPGPFGSTGQGTLLLWGVQENHSLGW